MGTDPRRAVVKRNKGVRTAPPSVFSTLALGLLLVLIALPFATLIWIAIKNSNNAWPHLLQYVLPTAIGQTLGLLIIVALGTATIGAGTAWLTTMYNFPYRKTFSWLLVLPLAVPTYLAAYAHVEFFDFSGPIQTLLRDLTGFKSARDYWFPDIRSLTGAGLIFSVVLYPYVFLTCRLIYSRQGASILDVSRSLGATPARQFRKIGLPLARPAIAAGVALALMETLNDIGAVEILGVKTLSYAIYETWLNRDNLGGAVQMSLLTLVLVAILILLERHFRNQRRFSSSNADCPPSRRDVSKRGQVLCVIACLTPFLLGLGIPLWIFGEDALSRLSSLTNPDLLQAGANSLFVSTLSAGLATLIAYGVLEYGRLNGQSKIATFGRIITLGYAVPGTVLAIGLLIATVGFDNQLDRALRACCGVSSGLWVSGSIAVIVYACTIRFLAIAYGTIETGFLRISPHIDMAARALGRNARQTAVQVHLPILRPTLATAFLMVFVDTTKELSATLLLRPFDFETLATFVYDRTSQSATEEAAIAALMIIIIGFLPIWVLSKFTSPEHENAKPKKNASISARVKV